MNHQEEKIQEAAPAAVLSSSISILSRHDKDNKGEPEDTLKLDTSENKSSNKIYECEIMVVVKSRRLRRYAKKVRNYIRNEFGQRIRISYPGGFDFDTTMDSLRLCGTTFAICLRPSHAVHDSIDLNILNGVTVPQEHKRIPLHMAYTVISIMSGMGVKAVLSNGAAISRELAVLEYLDVDHHPWIKDKDPWATDGSANEHSDLNTGSEELKNSERALDVEAPVTRNVTSFLSDQLAMERETLENNHEACMDNLETVVLRVDSDELEDGELICPIGSDLEEIKSSAEDNVKNTKSSDKRSRSESLGSQTKRFKTSPARQTPVQRQHKRGSFQKYQAEEKKPRHSVWSRLGGKVEY